MCIYVHIHVHLHASAERLSCKILVVVAVPPLQNAADVKETATLMLTAMLGCIVFNETPRANWSQDVKRVEQGMLETMTIALRLCRKSCRVLVVLAVSPHENAANVATKNAPDKANCAK